MAKQPLANVVQHLFQIAARAEFKTLKDQELLKRYVEHRDDLALGELVRRYKGMIWYVCWRVLRQHQDVEDAFQATIMTLVRRAKTILSHETIEGWLHSTAFRVANNARKDRERRHAREERIAKMRREENERHPSRWDMGDVLDKELTHIPEKLRSPLILCYLEGMTEQEAAERLGVSIDALDSRLRRGREQLKKRLSKHRMELDSTMMLAYSTPGVHVPEVPHGLVERTLDMVRIMTLANGALETASISPQVALLVKGAMGMTLKLKLLLGSLLLSCVVVTAGAAKYAGILHLPLGTQRYDGKSDPANNPIEEPKSGKIPPRQDLYGDPLPPGALTRLGTERFRIMRNDSHGRQIVFTANGKGVGLLSKKVELFLKGEMPRLWDVQTGKPLQSGGDVLKGQNHAGSSLALSADGRLIAYTTKAKGVQIREVVTGKILRTFKGIQENSESPCAISPDGKTLITRSKDLLYSWDIATGKQIWKQKLAKKDLRATNALIFSPDSRMVAIGYRGENKSPSKEGRIELRDARTGAFLRTLGHPWELEEGDTFSFSSDNNTIIIAYSDDDKRKYYSVYLWDVVTGKERWHIDQQKLFSYYRHPTFSPNGQMVALYENNQQSLKIREIGLYEVATGKKRGSCQFHRLRDFGFGHYNPLTFSPDSRLIAYLEGSLIRCWDTDSGKIASVPLFGHEATVHSVNFTRDGRTLASSGVNESIRLWDSLTGQQQRILKEGNRPQSIGQSKINASDTCVHCVISANGKILAGARIDLSEDLDFRADICLWDAATGRELRHVELDLQSPNLELRELALSPDGKLLAAWWSGRPNPHFVTVWDVDTGKQLFNKIEGMYPKFSPDSTSLLTYKNGMLNLWKATTGQKISAVTTAEFQDLRGWKITPDWQTLTCCYFDMEKSKYSCYFNSLQLDQQSKLGLGRPHHFDILKQGFKVSSWALSPTGKMLAWADAKASIHLVETATGAERMRFEGHRDTIHSLAFSPDSLRLASGSEDTTILVWDVTGGWLDDRGQWRSARLSDPQVQNHWKALAYTDAEQAGRAMWTLVAASKQTVAFLSKQLSPVVPKNQSSAQKIAQLIKDLDSDKYAVRQKAFDILSKLGEAAEADIRQVLEKQPSVEVGRRLKLLLGAIENQRKEAKGDELRWLRALEVLEQIGTPEARQVLETLSQGAPTGRLRREAQKTLYRLQQVAASRAIEPR